MFSQFSIDECRNHCPVDLRCDNGICTHFPGERCDFGDDLFRSLWRLYIICRFLEAGCLFHVAAAFRQKRHDLTIAPVDVRADFFQGGAVVDGGHL